MDAKTITLLEAARAVVDDWPYGAMEDSVPALRDAVEAMEVEDDNEPPSEDSIEA